MGRGKHCSEKDRDLIKILRQEGKTYKYIAETLGCSQNMITNALKWKEKTEKRGRPRKTSFRTDREIIKYVKKHPFATSTEIKQQLQLNIDTSVVRRRLLQHNMRARSARKVPLLTTRHIRCRLEFAKEHVLWSPQKWRNILWSDESKINLFGPDGSRHHVRRPKNTEYSSRYTVKTIKHGGGSIMVWACFSWNGTGPIYWIKETLNQNIYINLLEQVMLPYAEENMPLLWTYQQDNDPKHTSKAVKAWFERNNINVLKWPAQSPDLNPIENLWGEVKRAIQNKNSKNKNELWDIVQTAWREIPVDTCRKLVDSMPRRCSAVIRNKGYSTKY